MTTGSSSGVPADFAFIYSVDELHAGNDIGQLPEAPQSAPAFLRAHGQLMHQGHAAFGAVAISGLGRSESKLLRSEEHTSELQSRGHLVCRLLLENNKEPCMRREREGATRRAAVGHVRE